MSSSRLKIGTLEISPPLLLAPMVGLSHSSLRLLLLEMGGVGLYFTEMLSARRLPHDNPRLSPLLSRDQREQPLFYQLFVADKGDVAAAIAKVEALGADGVDLNLGCPAPQVRRRGAGGFLAEDLPRVQSIVAAMRRATSLPLSAKIRLGSTLHLPELMKLCTLLENEGVDMLTVHARLHGEKFCRPPRWRQLKEIKEQLSIPIIANGGVFSVADGRRCLAECGADGLMIGRGGVHRPWLFQELAMELYGCTAMTKPDQVELYFRFVELLVERFAPERRLGRLKQFTHYYADNFPFGHHLATSVQKTHSIEEAQDAAQRFFSQVGCTF